MSAATASATGSRLSVTARDRGILRDMARRVAEIAADPAQQEKARRWQRHNDLQHERPLVLAFPEGAWEDIGAAEKYVNRTESEFARGHEWYLWQKRYYHEHIRDDSVIEPVVLSPVVVRNTGWGIACSTTDSGTHKGASAYHGVIQSVADIEALRAPQVTVDHEESARLLELTTDIFGDILSVRQHCTFSTMFSPLDTLIHWLGIERLFTALIAEPELVHAAVSRLTEEQIRILRELEAQGALRLNNRGDYVGSGGTGFTAQLPQPGMSAQRVRTQDLWGSATAQIFSEISPEMHEEFALRYEARYLELFGLSCYGCCEPLHLKLDLLKTHIPNLRRVSISPWADIAMSAEKLGADYVYSWKPNPVLVSSPDFDPERIRRANADFLAKTGGCVTEIIMKDTHTVHGDTRRIPEWVRITKEMVDSACG